MLAEGRGLQARLADLFPVVVGDTAAALHCEHRYSLDVDVVTPQLNTRFDEVKTKLAEWEGWRTNRLNPPVLILGQHGGVELGVRQLRRAVPLQTTRLSELVVPTAAEMLRVKSFLLTERRSTRDFVDVAALAVHLGGEPALRALSVLNLVYGPREPQTWVSAFAEACEGEVLDAAKVPLPNYKGLREPFTEWAFVAGECQKLGRALLKLELEGGLAIGTSLRLAEFCRNMNPSRSTETTTPLDWLNIIQRGGTEEWKRLYQLCRDPEIARQMAAIMPLRDPDLLASARLWKFLLEDLHPGLRVELDETHRNIGV